MSGWINEQERQLMARYEQVFRMLSYPGQHRPGPISAPRLVLDLENALIQLRSATREAMLSGATWATQIKPMEPIPIQMTPEQLETFDQRHVDAINALAEANDRLRAAGLEPVSIAAARELQRQRHGTRCPTCMYGKSVQGCRETCYHSPECEHGHTQDTMPKNPPVLDAWTATLTPGKVAEADRAYATVQGELSQLVEAAAAKLREGVYPSMLAHEEAGRAMRSDQQVIATLFGTMLVALATESNEDAGHGPAQLPPLDAPTDRDRVKAFLDALTTLTQKHGLVLRRYLDLITVDDGYTRHTQDTITLAANVGWDAVLGQYTAVSWRNDGEWTIP